ncbi:DUF4158 domain-containing protein [Actinoallomurus sp. NPDC052274]|uniref:DUF4158 domain-containing protein n=1 Tax=Actinoallomurus sp. NPDC052274 TaxID=3155420 RepID=UPI00343A60DB
MEGRHLLDVGELGGEPADAVLGERVELSLELLGEGRATRVPDADVGGRDLHVFYSPSPDEAVWARERTDTDDHLLALVVALKCFQRMGRFPKAGEVPEAVVDHVRRCLERGEDAAAVYSGLEQQPNGQSR